MFTENCSILNLFGTERAFFHAVEDVETLREG